MSTIMFCTQMVMQYKVIYKRSNAFELWSTALVRKIST